MKKMEKRRYHMFDDFAKHKLTIPQANIYLIEIANSNTKGLNIRLISEKNPLLQMK